MNLYATDPFEGKPQFDKFRTDTLDILREVQGQREEILKAFIAKYGFEPERAIQVSQQMPDGTTHWFIVQRSDERMAELSRLSSQL